MAGVPDTASSRTRQDSMSWRELGLPRAPPTLGPMLHAPSHFLSTSCVCSSLPVPCHIQSGRRCSALDRLYWPLFSSPHQRCSTCPTIDLEVICDHPPLAFLPRPCFYAAGNSDGLLGPELSCGVYEPIQFASSHLIPPSMCC